jgi:hypothetical protein
MTRPRVTPSTPRPVSVKAVDSAVLVVDGQAVVQELESWIVEDRWWTEQPIHRRYWELVMVSGRCVVVFHDLVSGGWFTQAA